MLKPSGEDAGNVDPLLLIHLWAHHVEAEATPNDLKMKFAGIGKPGYYLNEDIIHASIQYWKEKEDSVSKIKKNIESKVLSSEDCCSEIANSSTGIDYGLPAGENMEKIRMAQALSRWYENEIKPEEILFTVGGMMALKMLFKIINSEEPKGIIITPLPYYPFYNNREHKNNLHFINSMQWAGFKLTAASVKKGIEEANQLALKNNTKISAFLFCDPNNPLGAVIGKKEWEKIAKVLMTTPKDVPIILDEAYAEMVFEKKHESLFHAVPELKDRLIILRSATKSLSASGERMAIVICFNKQWRERIIDEILASFLHLPKSLQYAYSYAMQCFSEERRKGLAQFYQVQAEYVQKRLKRMNAHIPNPEYKAESTFYVLANLKDLIGTSIPLAATKALQKSGPITTDTDICYSLLFEDRIMISALSFFGLDPQLGYVRITCSQGFAELQEIMDRLERKLNYVRKAKERG